MHFFFFCASYYLTALMTNTVGVDDLVLSLNRWCLTWLHVLQSCQWTVSIGKRKSCQHVHSYPQMLIFASVVHLISCHIHTCLSIIPTNLVVNCTTHVRNDIWPHTCPLTRATWSSPDPHHTNAIQPKAIANTSLVLVPIINHYSAHGIGRGVFEAFGGCKGWCLLDLYIYWYLYIYNIDHVIKCTLQWIEECTLKCLPSTLERKTNTQDCHSKKGQRFPRCTLTKWGQSVKVTTSTIICGGA